MSESPDRRAIQRQKRRRQILEAALRVFAQKGFHTANVSDIAAEVGVSQGTIYWYFESKDELLREAVLSFFADFEQEAFGSMLGANTAVEKLFVLEEAMGSFVRDAAGLFPLFMEYWAS